MASVNSILPFCLLATTCVMAVTCSTLNFEPSHTEQADSYPFWNTSLPWDERVDDLVSRLTLDEIQLQMARGGTGENGGPAPPIPRLGIGPYNWDTECLRGDAETSENATAFPQAIGLSATFSPDLMYRVASAIGAEVRGKHNDFVRRGIYGTHTGASCFSPVINIARDVRWGRLQETYGEDPFLSGVLAQSFVRGLQGNHPRYVQASAGCKHFDAHAGPDNIPVSRMSFNAVVSDTDWRMTFLPAFKKCVEAGTFSLMCSYNRLNGVPSCANKKLLTDVLREEWGFKGYVVSDQSAIENIINDHHYLNNSVDTVAACVKAGCNLELSPNLVQPVYLSIVDAINQGKLTEPEVRERVKPLFYTRMRLGEFDPPGNNPYAKLDRTAAETPEHRALAVEAAMKSFVLLKNHADVLPFKVGDYKKVAILGPMADNVEQQFGDYSPNQDRSYTKTPLQGLREIFPDIKHGKACKDGTPCQDYDRTVVTSVGADADLIILALGTGQAVESEGIDRANTELPGYQLLLANEASYVSQKAKVVMLLFNAGPLNISLFDWTQRPHAMMACFFPSQATGDALVATLTNKGGNSSPAGRMSVTWPYIWEMPPMVNYSMEGRTYRYLNDTPLYPFGYGLSYSHFSYDGMMLDYGKEPKEDVNVTLYVKNNGPFDADEVIQCYIEWGNKALPVPMRQLAYFNRVHIKASQEIKHVFSVSWESWTFWENGEWNSNAGELFLHCGGQQPFQRKTVPSNIRTIKFMKSAGSGI